MKNEDLISIIVPIYNVEKFIDKCMDTILGQTYKNIEIVLVDDGSPDNCPKIIDEYAKKYDNVFAYHKKNGGLSSARNFGLKKSHGKYICFIDSDDYISTKYIEVLYNKIVEEKADIAICNYYRVYKNKEVECVAGKFKTEYFITPAAWNKLYKRNLFDNIEYPIGKYYEDLGTTPKLIMNCKKISYVDDFLYYYFQNDNSIMKNVNPKIYDIYEIIDEIIRYSKKQKKYDEYKEQIELATIFHVLIGTSYRISRDKNFKKKDLIEIENNVKKHFPNYSKNRKINDLSLEYRLFIKMFKMKFYNIIYIGLKIINLLNYKYK